MPTCLTSSDTPHADIPASSDTPHADSPASSDTAHADIPASSDTPHADIPDIINNSSYRSADREHTAGKSVGSPEIGP